jgi:transposase
MCRQLEKELGTDHGVVKRVADQLGYGPESVRKWWRDADVADGLAGPDAQRVAELESALKDASQELRELRRANEILKRASAFFAAELDRPQR